MTAASVSYTHLTTKTEGTGIGLSLCRQIIKRHGGNLYLQESGQGRTLFVIEWPKYFPATILPTDTGDVSIS